MRDKNKNVVEDVAPNKPEEVQGEASRSNKSEGDSQVYIPTAGQELEKYRYADAVISCAACGHDTVINHPEFTNVEIGINLPPLYTTNQHFLALACENCQNKLTLRMIKAKYPPAYEFNYDNAYEVPGDAKLTWVAGDEAISYEVWVKEFTDTLGDTEEPKFISKGVVETAEFTLDLKEDTSYMIRIDTKYSEERTVVGTDVFLSTKDKPEGLDSQEEEKTDNAE
jgi:hypothetical protein